MRKVKKMNSRYKQDWDEILENIVSSLALAGMIGINLEEELSSLLNLLEAVSGEAS